MQVRGDLDRRAEASPGRDSFGELLGQLAYNSAALMRDEIQLARQEINEKISMLRTGATIAVTGVVIGFIALLTLTAAAVIGLAKYIGAGNSALIIGGGLATIGITTAIAGIGQIKKTSLKPKQTIETLEEGKEWLKELT